MNNENQELNGLQKRLERLKQMPNEEPFDIRHSESAFDKNLGRVKLKNYSENVKERERDLQKWQEREDLKESIVGGRILKIYPMPHPYPDLQKEANKIIEDFPTTIEQAKEKIRKYADKGLNCPCCNQYCRIYKRKLTSSMVKGLILINGAKLSEKFYGEYVHIENFLKTKDCSSAVRGDVPKLRFWGLIEPKPKVNNYFEIDSKTNGLYRVTELGKMFIHGRALVQSKVKIYNNQFQGFDGPEIDVWVAINNKFNYNELINS